MQEYLAALLNELAEAVERGEQVVQTKCLLVLAVSHCQFARQLVDSTQLLFQLTNFICGVLQSTFDDMLA